MVCGSVLEYLLQAESHTCIYCNRAEQGHIVCTAGHFVCDACHGLEARGIIEQIAFTSRENDPLAMAELMISHAGLPMLGCEHAFIAAGALIGALKNSPYGKGNITNTAVREIFDRTAKQAVGGYCGLTGVCGIAPALGACFSVFLGARCGSDREQKIVMDAVIRVMQALSALTGPSCCKAYVRAGLREAVALLWRAFRNPAADQGQCDCLQTQRKAFSQLQGREMPLFSEAGQESFLRNWICPGYGLYFLNALLTVRFGRRWLS